ncbi:uncharacterized protein [Spinacia oleracea]|uniref:DUF4283 domain-containing protein n=1 Tax=Spinacia oleracea TaxID=3562 RepID=A0ABM3QQD6_SPIOL|nr:uncharacterized protein LOC130461468 [Spinacia oleracea]
MENRDKVLDEIKPTFDKKPVICKPWHKDIVDFKDEVKVVPIWIHLKNLELKFWGVRSLSKIVGSIGKFLQADQATVHRDKLQFARVQIEVAVIQNLPDKVQFQDEHGKLKCINIGYEWKPIVCENCKLLGHLAEDCRKKKGKKKWVDKVVSEDVVAKPTDEFVQATRTVQHRKETTTPVMVTNSFHVLDVLGVAEETGEKSGVSGSGRNQESIDGGGIPPDIDG